MPAPSPSPDVLRLNRGSLRVRGVSLPWGARTYVMGVVNVTPDSFSGDGRINAGDAIAHGIAQAAEADLLDVGAESTRPGYRPVDDATEISRLLPVLQGLRERLPDAVISADTHKAAVFRAARRCGADMLNSIWGVPPELLEAAAEYGVPIVIMHNKAEARYEGAVMDDVLRYLSEQAERAVGAGIAPQHVILDPGIGFGKTADHNIDVLRDLHRLPSLGFPTLIGTSRKSTIGKLTGRPPGERVAGTTATTALAVAAGIDVVRVHDVGAARDAVRVSDAIIRGWRPEAWT